MCHKPHRTSNNWELQEAELDHWDINTKLPNVFSHVCQYYFVDVYFIYIVNFIIHLLWTGTAIQIFDYSKGCGYLNIAPVDYLYILAYSKF